MKFSSYAARINDKTTCLCEQALGQTCFKPLGWAVCLFPALIAFRWPHIPKRCSKAPTWEEGGWIEHHSNNIQVHGKLSTFQCCLVNLDPKTPTTLEHNEIKRQKWSWKLKARVGPWRICKFQVQGSLLALHAAVSSRSKIAPKKMLRRGFRLTSRCRVNNIYTL